LYPSEAKFVVVYPAEDARTSAFGARSGAALLMAKYL